MRAFFWPALGHYARRRPYDQGALVRSDTLLSNVLGIALRVRTRPVARKPTETTRDSSRPIFRRGAFCRPSERAVVRVRAVPQALAPLMPCIGVAADKVAGKTRNSGTGKEDPR